MSGELKLCYVDGAFAYFTTQELSDQWGDDWNDAPYEHNAGSPYAFHPHDEKQGKARWHITKVAYEGSFDTPSSLCSNSPYSVEQINSGAVAWLATSSWAIGEKVAIPAGVSLDKFCELIQRGGGTVYLPLIGTMR